MKKMNKKILCLAMAALVLTASVSIKSALAYFTTYIVAAGEEQLSVGFTQTQLDEKIEGLDKTIKVKNTGSVDCYVRVKVIVSDESANDEGRVEVKESLVDNWTDGSNGFYEYNSILKAGDETTALLVDVTVDNNDKPFDIVIVQEYTPVLYDENGTPYADWDGSDFVIEER